MIDTMIGQAPSDNPRMAVQNGAHEIYVQTVRRIAIERAIERATIDQAAADHLANVKLVYGLGLRGGYRGVTVYGAWTNGHGPTDCIEIAAVGEESWLQLAGTTVHELAHVLAGQSGGHAESWKDACGRLGLRRAKAAGMRYSLAALDPILRARVYALAQTLTDGGPTFLSAMGGASSGARPCSAGYGTRGGTSRGTGSGSRLLKVSCATCGYVARVTRTWIASHGAPHCGTLDHGRMEEEGTAESERADAVRREDAYMRREAQRTRDYDDGIIAEDDR